MDKNVWIKCLYCDEEYITLSEDWKKTDISYICTKCNKEIGVSYFGECYNCHKKVGFYPISFKKRLMTAGLKFVEGYLNPIASLKVVERIFDNVPSSSHMGFCPYCHRQYVKCPHCGRSSEVNPNTDINDIIICSHCSGKMRMP